MAIKPEDLLAGFLGQGLETSAQGGKSVTLIQVFEKNHNIGNYDMPIDMVIEIDNILYTESGIKRLPFLSKSGAYVIMVDGNEYAAFKKLEKLGIKKYEPT